MLASIAHRGTGGGTLWLARQAAFGNTVQSRDGQIFHASAAGLSITADARIDNRTELLDQLRPAGGESSDDAELLLAAYERWGVDCACHILGDFAFAVWDENQSRLVCFRDQFGVKPLYYRSSADGFAFASEIKALLCDGQAPPTPDPRQIASYLLGFADDPAATSYIGILRLPPRHGLIFQDDAVSLHEYWTLEADAPMRASEFSDAFAERFDAAVATRLQGPGPVAAMLSGGLDSSSIVSVASRQLASRGQPPLRTYSMIYERDASLDERRYINEVIALHRPDARFMSGDDLSPFDEFDEVLTEQDELFLSPRLGISRSLYWRAAREGTRVLLDGHGGDEVVSHGFGRFSDLARSREWLTLARELFGFRGQYHDSYILMFLKLYAQHGKSRLRRVPSELERAWSRLNRRNDTGSRTLLDLLDTDFARSTDVAERHRESIRMPADPRGDETVLHRRTLGSGFVPHAFEVLDRTSAAAGIEARYPFWDRRLVTFCLSLPSEEKLAGGYSRLILRKAMENILPPKVQWRHDKTDFGDNISKALINSHPSINRIFLSENTCIQPFVNISAVRQRYRSFLQSPSSIRGDELFFLWRLVSLARWLERTEYRGRAA